MGNATNPTAHISRCQNRLRAIVYVQKTDVGELATFSNFEIEEDPRCDSGRFWRCRKAVNDIE
jgi:hypothetical protein